MGEATITLDRSALRHNLAEIKKLAPRVEVLAMVKANAYGHGMVEIATMLANDVAYLGVATLAEGQVLSQQLPKARPDIVVMRGPRSKADALSLVQHNLHCVIHHLDQLQWLEGLPARSLTVWLKINTGMNRLGIQPAEVATVFSQLQHHVAIKDVKLMSHLGTANDLNGNKVCTQLDLFQNSTQTYAVQTSLANSAALLHHPQTHRDIVRPGLLLYGISSLEAARALALKPVMTFSAPIIDIQDLQSGEWVGYGATWQATKPTRIAIVGAGYANGYPMHMPSGAPVLVNGQCAQTVGQVSMDMLGIDVTHCDDIQIGASVTLWGKGLPIETIAKHANMSPYALVTAARAA